MAEPAGGAKKPSDKKPASGDPMGKFPVEVIAFLFIFLLLFYQGAFNGGFGFLTGAGEGVADNVFVKRLTLVLKILSGLVTSAAIIGIVYVIIQNARFRPALTVKKEKETEAESEALLAEEAPTPVPKKIFTDEWQTLKEKLDVASDKDAAMLIIEADSLVDKAMQVLGISGDTMGERLKGLQHTGFKYEEELWEAHKIRNQVAHGDMRDVHYSDAVLAIDRFEKALKEFDMI